MTVTVARQENSQNLSRKFWNFIRLAPVFGGFNEARFAGRFAL